MAISELGRLVRIMERINADRGTNSETAATWGATVLDLLENAQKGQSVWEIGVYLEGRVPPKGRTISAQFFPAFNPETNHLAIFNIYEDNPSPSEGKVAASLVLEARKEHPGIHRIISFRSQSAKLSTMQIVEEVSFFVGGIVKSAVKN